MSWFGNWLGDSGGSSSSGSGITFQNLTNATTADAIRDRMLDVIEAITPEYLPGDKFRRYRNEGNGKFLTWVEANPVGSLRRFQVRFDGTGTEPAVSNYDYEERLAVYTVTLAYPMNNRAGAGNALDRDTAMDRDQDSLMKAIGLYGRPNFSSPFPDAVIRSWDCTRVDGIAASALVVKTTYAFIRQLFTSL